MRTKKIFALLTALCLSLSTSLFTQKVNATVKNAGEINGNTYVMTRSTETESAHKAFTMQQFINAAPNWFEGEHVSRINSLKIHMFKKPHKMIYTENVNLFASQTFPGQNPSSGTFVGEHTYSAGTATVNGHKYDLSYNGWIVDKNDEQMPATLMYNASGHNIRLYNVVSNYADPDFEKDPSNANYYAQGFYTEKYLSIPSNTKHMSTIAIPTHHQAYDILGTRYVPVLAHADAGENGIIPFLIKESDYKTLTKRNHMTMRNLDTGTTMTQNGNHLTSHTAKWALNQDYKGALDTIKHPKSTRNILRQSLNNVLWSVNHYGSAYFI